MPINLTGVLSKMDVSLKDGIARYYLPIGKEKIYLNDVIGSNISFNYQNAIYCANCNAVTKKSYSQGHCYLCSQRLASCDLCIMKPETCHYHLGTCREPEWGKKHCFSKHIVYLANSSGVKVGITRFSNTPSRWIDQGAISALPILEVENRLDSGMLEMQFKEFITDKTNWRKMLKNEVENINLSSVRDELLPKININNAKVLTEKQIDISYSVLEYPNKVTSLSFDKTPQIKGKLLGIKGQYLILDIGVLNIRKFSSYLISFTT